VLRENVPRVWTSITGHGRAGAAGDRVAFGDDAAVAGGLVRWAADTPMFLGDAVADPLTGMVAAAATLLSWNHMILNVPDVSPSSTAVLLDVAMARSAASVAERRI
jgi:hypothetical protein